MFALFLVAVSGENMNPRSGATLRETCPTSVQKAQLGWVQLRVRPSTALPRRTCALHRVSIAAQPCLIPRETLCLRNARRTFYPPCLVLTDHSLGFPLLPAKLSVRCFFFFFFGFVSLFHPEGFALNFMERGSAGD